MVVGIYEEAFHHLPVLREPARPGGHQEIRQTIRRTETIHQQQTPAQQQQQPGPTEGGRHP